MHGDGRIRHCAFGREEPVEQLVVPRRAQSHCGDHVFFARRFGRVRRAGRGAPGKSPSIYLESFEELPSNHPTPGTASLTEVAPATDAARRTTRVG